MKILAGSLRSEKMVIFVLLGLALIASMFPLREEIQNERMESGFEGKARIR